MRSSLLAAAAAALLHAPALAQPTTPPPSQQPVRTGAGVNALLYVLAPIVGLAEVQARLSPAKPSCWNDGATEVAGCRVVERVQGQ